MKKIKFLIFIVALFVGVSLAGIFSIGSVTPKIFNFSVNFGEKGSGNVVTEKREVSEFKAVEVGGIFVVEIVAQKDFAVEVETDDNLLPLVKTESDGETLHIETVRNFGSTKPTKIRISAPDIENLKISGVASVSLSNLQNESLNIDASGASKIYCDGQTTDLTVEMSGASQLDGEKLSAENVSVDASGASKASVAVRDSLKTDLSGASKVVYYGNPANVEKKTSGASSVVGR